MDLLIRDVKQKLKRSLPYIVSVALIAAMFTQLPIESASATGVLTAVSNTLETSAFSTASKQTIKFTTATALTADNSAGTADFSFKVWYPTNAGTDPFSVPSLTTSDISATCTSCSSVTMSINAVTLNNEGGNATNDSVLIKIDTGTSGSTLPIGSVVTLTIGTGSTKITNPASSAAGCTSNVCSLTIDTTESTTNAITPVDEQLDLVAFNSGVTVSATVNETLTFTISAVTNSSCTGDTGTSPTAVTTTSTTVPFGTVNGNSFYVGCQDLAISTNGAGGYSVTSSENTNLKSAASAFIADTSCDSSCTTTSGTAWATNTNNGLGFYCENITNTPCDSAGLGTSKYRQFACTGINADCGSSGAETPQAVISKSSPSGASGDTGRVHFKLSVAGNQSAGTYSNTVTHIATATF